MTYLTDAEICPGSPNSYRFFVELASNEVELDAYDEPVPVAFKTLDVLVVEPTIEAIRRVIANQNWLKDFSIVDYWQPDPDCPF